MKALRLPLYRPTIVNAVYGENITDIYYEDHTKSIIHYVGKVQRFLMLEQLVNIGTTAFQRVSRVCFLNCPASYYRIAVSFAVSW
jgi:hypothetical protein